MYVDNWTRVQGKEVHAFLKHHNAIDGRRKASSRSTQVAVHTLPFYAEAVLIRLRDRSWPKDLNLYYLGMPGEKPVRLDGTCVPIHTVNAAAPVILTSQNVLAYLKFFCFFIRAPAGPFLIAEHLSDPHMPEVPDARARACMASIVRAARYDGKTAEGHFLCDGVVLYADTLFEARFDVAPNGVVTMLDDEERATNLPVRVQAPIV